MTYDEQKKEVPLSDPGISCTGSDADGMAGLPDSGPEDSGSDPGGSREQPGGGQPS